MGADEDGVPDGEPGDEGGRRAPASALAAMATIRTPGVDRATATDRGPPLRRRAV